MKKVILNSEELEATLKAVTEAYENETDKALADVLYSVIEALEGASEE